MRSTSRSFALAAAFALCASGCVLVSADVPQICAKQTVRVAGQAQVTALSSSTVSQDLPLPSVGAEVLSRLTLAGGSVTAEAGNLDFIDAMSVSLQPATSGSEPIMLIAYQRGAGAAPQAIALAAADQKLLPYLAGGAAKLQITITGKPPQAGVTLGVELCMNAGVDVNIDLTK